MRKVKSQPLIVVGMLMLAFTAVTNVRTQGQETERVVIQPKTTSPFELARLANLPTIQMKRIEAGIAKKKWGRSVNLFRGKNQQKDTVALLEVDLTGLWRRLGIPAENFTTCERYSCEATIYREELDNKPGRELVLELKRTFNFYRLLVYGRVRPGARRWKLLGFYDHDFNRYQMAEHRAVRAFGKNWLVIRGQEGSGSGYYLYGETWFEVSERGIKPVLHYSQDGLTDPGLAGLDWSLKSRAVALQPFRAKRPTLKLAFTVTYKANGFEDESFTRRFVNRRFAYYAWNQQMHEFDFDSRRSTISEHEMNLVANVETDAPPEGEKIGGSTFFSSMKGFVGSGLEMFVRLNTRSLLQIARGRSLPAKKWLAQFLKQCDDIPEKLAVEKALNKSPTP